MNIVPSSQALRVLRAAAASSHTITHNCPRLLHTRRSISLPMLSHVYRSLHSRSFTSTTHSLFPPPKSSPPPPSSTSPPATRDRGPPSKEDTQTDFAAMDVLGNSAIPATTIDACLSSSFHLDNGLRTPPGVGILLLSGECFTWRPWLALSSSSPSTPAQPGHMLTPTGLWNVDDAKAWAALELLWPRPDLLILGTGKRTIPLAKGVRERLAGLGVRVDVQDTRNAAAEFNLLARERGTTEVAAAMVPVGWDLAEMGRALRDGR
ncbi:MAG: hypothetical protein Q9227_000068 [Pyrenula ochraceoflavens]